MNSISKDEILSERLASINIELGEIADAIDKESIVDEYIVFAYTSQFDGLGTKESDIDIYVLCDKLPLASSVSKGLQSVGMVNIRGTLIDIEYWLINDVLSIIADKKKLVYYDYLKLLHRLLSSVIIFGTDKGVKIQEAISDCHIETCISSYYSKLAKSYFDDALKMYNTSHFESSIICGRLSLMYAIAMYNASHGKANMKEKWIARILCDNNGFGSKEVLARFLDIMIYSCAATSNIEMYCESILEFISDILNPSI